VLQAMLSGVALSQMAAAAASALPVVLCASSHGADPHSSGGSEQPDKAISCAACALCTFGAACDTPPPVAQALRSPVVTSAARLAATQLAAVAAKPTGPRLSQGPPLIA
jgi:hypothetical protein